MYLKILGKQGKKVMMKRGVAALLAAGTFVWLGGRAVVAQQTPSTQNTSTQQNQTGMSAVSDSDKQFLTKNAQDSLYEFASAQLAVQRAQSNDVAQVALRIMNDHAKFNEQLMQLARQKQLSLPVTVSGHDKSKLDRLSRLKGAEFDRAYTQELAKANASDIQDFKREASTSKDQDVQAFVAQFLPTQQEHLQLATNLSNSNSGMTGNGGSSGTTGTSGSSGTTGTSGSSGTPATSGSSGTPGTSGSSGTPGTSGQ